ncbi:helix-turn-helix domain-containing protein [Kineobactrum sediminis]|nr:helix-turn-helix domain-containing protein [Kineobactrum sediminis]
MATPFRDPVLYQIARTADYVLRESEGRGNFVEPVLDAMRQYCLDRYLGTEPFSKNCSNNTHAAGGLPGFKQRKLEEFIQSRLSSPILVEELAERVKLSPAHFSRAFLATYNVSPHRFLLERRIDRAAELLRSSLLEVEEIALRTGFSSSSHLGFQFKKQMAKTPSQYRRAHAKILS